MDTPKAISDLRELLGKSVLVDITLLDHKDELLSEHQFHGRVDSLDDGLVHFRPGSGEGFFLPPHPSAFVKARPGKYRLRSTGEVVVDPDFIASWTIRGPAPDQRRESEISDEQP